MSAQSSTAVTTTASSRNNSPSPFRSHHQHNVSVGSGVGYGNGADNHTHTSRTRALARELAKDTAPVTQRDLDPIRHDVEKLKSDFRELIRKNKFVSPDVVDTTWRELLNVKAFIGYNSSSGAAVVGTAGFRGGSGSGVAAKTWSSYDERFLQEDYSGEGFGGGVDGGRSVANRNLQSEKVTSKQQQQRQYPAIRNRSSAARFDPNDDGEAYDVDGNEEELESSSVTPSKPPPFANGEDGQDKKKDYDNDDDGLSPLNAEDVFATNAFGPSATFTAETVRKMIAHEVTIAMRRFQREQAHKQRQEGGDSDKTLNRGGGIGGGCYTTRNGSHCCERNAEIHLEANRRLRISLDESNARAHLFQSFTTHWLCMLGREHGRLISVYDAHLANLHRTAPDDVNAFLNTQQQQLHQMRQHQQYQPSRSHAASSYSSRKGVAQNGSGGGIVDSDHSDLLYSPPHHAYSYFSTFARTASKQQRSSAVVQQQQQHRYHQHSGYRDDGDDDESEREDDENVSRVQKYQQQQRSNITHQYQRQPSNNRNLSVDASPPPSRSHLVSNLVSDRFRAKAEALVAIIREDPFLLDQLADSAVKMGSLARRLQKDVKQSNKKSKAAMDAGGEGGEVRATASSSASASAFVPSSSSDWLSVIGHAAQSQCDATVEQALAHFDAIVAEKIVPRLNEIAKGKIRSIVDAAEGEIARIAQTTEALEATREERADAIVSQVVNRHAADFKSKADGILQSLQDAVKEASLQSSSNLNIMLKEMTDAANKKLNRSVAEEVKRREEESRQLFNTLVESFAPLSAVGSDNHQHDNSNEKKRRKNMEKSTRSSFSSSSSSSDEDDTTREHNARRLISTEMGSAPKAKKNDNESSNQDWGSVSNRASLLFVLMPDGRSNVFNAALAERRGDEDNSTIQDLHRRLLLLNTADSGTDGANNNNKVSKASTSSTTRHLMAAIGSIGRLVVSSATTLRVSSGQHIPFVGGDKKKKDTTAPRPNFTALPSSSGNVSDFIFFTPLSSDELQSFLASVKTMIVLEEERFATMLKRISQFVKKANKSLAARFEREGSPKSSNNKKAKSSSASSPPSLADFFSNTGASDQSSPFSSVLNDIEIHTTIATYFKACCLDYFDQQNGDKTAVPVVAVSWHALIVAAHAIAERETRALRSEAQLRIQQERSAIRRQEDGREGGRNGRDASSSSSSETDDDEGDANHHRKRKNMSDPPPPSSFISLVPQDPHRQRHGHPILTAMRVFWFTTQFMNASQTSASSSSTNNGPTIDNMRRSVSQVSSQYHGVGGGGGGEQETPANRRTLSSMASSSSAAVVAAAPLAPRVRTAETRWATAAASVRGSSMSAASVADESDNDYSSPHPRTMSREAVTQGKASSSARVSSSIPAVGERAQAPSVSVGSGVGVGGAVMANNNDDGLMRPLAAAINHLADALHNGNERQQRMFIMQQQQQQQDIHDESEAGEGPSAAALSIRQQLAEVEGQYGALQQQLIVAGTAGHQTNAPFESHPSHPPLSLPLVAGGGGGTRAAAALFASSSSSSALPYHQQQQQPQLFARQAQYADPHHHSMAPLYPSSVAQPPPPPMTTTTTTTANTTAAPIKTAAEIADELLMRVEAKMLQRMAATQNAHHDDDSSIILQHNDDGGVEGGGVGERRDGHHHHHPNANPNAHNMSRASSHRSVSASAAATVRGGSGTTTPSKKRVTVYHHHHSYIAPNPATIATATVGMKVATAKEIGDDVVVSPRRELLMTLPPPPPPVPSTALASSNSMAPNMSSGLNPMTSTTAPISPTSGIHTLSGGMMPPPPSPPTETVDGFYSTATTSSATATATRPHQHHQQQQPMMTYRRLTRNVSPSPNQVPFDVVTNTATTSSTAKQFVATRSSSSAAHSVASAASSYPYPILIPSRK